jgi:hypothetical protein
MIKHLVTSAIVVISLVLAATAFLAVRHDTLSEADHKATLLALSKFHIEYLKQKGVDRSDYLARLEKECQKDIWLFGEYTMDAENQP